MKYLRRKIAKAASLSLATLCACSGGHTSSAILPLSKPTAPPGPLGHATFSITIPKRSAASGKRGAAYVNALTDHMLVEWGPPPPTTFMQTGKVTIPNYTFFSNCTQDAAGTNTCLEDVLVPAQSNISLRISLLDASENVLNIGRTGTISIAQDAANQLPPLALSAVVDSVAMTLGTAIALIGTNNTYPTGSFSVPINITYYYLNGQSIAGVGTFAQPVQISSSNPLAPLSLNGQAPSQTVTPQSAADVVTIVYNGTGVLTSTITLTTVNPNNLYSTYTQTAIFQPTDPKSNGIAKMVPLSSPVNAIASGVKTATSDDQSIYYVQTATDTLGQVAFGSKTAHACTFSNGTAPVDLAVSPTGDAVYVLNASTIYKVPIVPGVPLSGSCAQNNFEQLVLAVNQGTPSHLGVTSTGDLYYIATGGGATAPIGFISNSIFGTFYPITVGIDAAERPFQLAIDASGQAIVADTSGYLNSFTVVGGGLTGTALGSALPANPVLTHEITAAGDTYAVASNGGTTTYQRFVPGPTYSSSGYLNTATSPIAVAKASDNRLYILEASGHILSGSTIQSGLPALDLGYLKGSPVANTGFSMLATRDGNVYFGADDGIYAFPGSSVYATAHARSTTTGVTK